MASSAGAVDAAATLSGLSIIREMKAGGIEFVISVPDITTAAGILAPLETGTNPRLIRVCKEDEGVGICAGLAHTGKRALLLIQQTGMLDSINAIRGVAVDYSLPVVMMVGLLEKEPDRRPRESARYGVRIVEPILEAMGVAYHEIEEQADVAKIKPAIDEAYAKSQPVVLLIGRRPLAS
jgi:sulfopyruvate decarboxylase TPP-binding subunit